MLDLAKVEKIRRYHCDGTSKGRKCTVKFDDPDAAVKHCAEEHKAENRRGITFTDKIKVRIVRSFLIFFFYKISQLFYKSIFLK